MISARGERQAHEEPTSPSTDKGEFIPLDGVVEPHTVLLSEKKWGEDLSCCTSRDQRMISARSERPAHDQPLFIEPHEEPPPSSTDKGDVIPVVGIVEPHKLPPSEKQSDEDRANSRSAHKAIAVGASGGGAVGGAGGGVVGAAVGLPLAPVTFGLSIPVCSTVGAITGAVSGAVSGGFVGRAVHRRSGKTASPQKNSPDSEANYDTTGLNCGKPDH